MIRTASFVLAATLLCTFGSAAAQEEPKPSPLQKQLDRLDLGVTAVGLFNSTVSGKVTPTAAANYNTIVSDEASNTVGVGVNIRYTAKPLVGIEFQYVYSRYTENYSTPPYGVQTQADEYSFGYLVTPKINFFGLQPYASAGMGTTAFKPTAHGGQGLPEKARATYYYSIGLQKDFTPYFGARAGFRETFFLAPDFGQNYLTILQHTSTYEPTAGFYLRF